MEPTTSAGLAGIIKVYGSTILGLVLGALTNRGRSIAEHITALVAGVTAALYLVPALAEWFSIQSPALINGMTVLAALFALTLVRAVSDQIAPAIEGLRKKFTGGDSNG